MQALVGPRLMRFPVGADAMSFAAMRRALPLLALSVLACAPRATLEEPVEAEVGARVVQPPKPPKPDAILVYEVFGGECVLRANGRLDCATPELVSEARIAELGPIDRAWFDYDGACVQAGDLVDCGEQPPDVLPTDARGHLRLPFAGDELLDLEWSSFSACAVRSDGSLWCVFNNLSGEGALRSFPVDGAIEVEVEDDNGCALLFGGGARCWFDSMSLPEARSLEAYCDERGRHPICAEPFEARARWPAPSHDFPEVVDVALGTAFMCLLDRAGAVRCLDQGAGWDFASLGADGSFMAVEGMPPLIEIGAGSRHACGRSEAGEVWCWGANEYGQLGDGSTRSSFDPAPVEVGTFPELTHLAVGSFSACALAGGSRHCWGWRRGEPSPPSQIPGVNASALVLAGERSCARERGDGGWSCWGGDTSTLEGLEAVSRVGPGQPSERFGRDEVCELVGDVLRCEDGDDELLVDLAGVRAVETRNAYSACALLGDRIECYNLSYVSPPHQRSIPADTLSFGGDEGNGCLLTRGGEVHCWSEPEGEARHVELPGPQREISVAGTAACALDQKGTLRCWSAGEAPTLAALGEVVELTGGYGLTCARERQGAVSCWGFSLVDSAREPEPTHEQPLRIELPAPAVELEAGDGQACARLDDGAVWCWGDGSAGQRGRLSRDFALRPRNEGPPPGAAE